MKKILIANDLLVGGGVENVLENLVRYLLRQGNEVTLMIPGCTQEQAQALFGERVTMYPAMRTLQEMKRYSLQWFWDRGLYVLQKQLYRIRFFLRQFDVQIALKEGPTMRDLAGLYAKKRLAWVHTDYQYMRWTKGCFRSDKYERKCMMRFDKVVCVSESTANSIIQTIGNPGNLCVKYNPLDCKRIHKKAQQPCLVEKGTAGLLFISVGRLTSQKNYPLLLNVCAELEKKYDFELWIVGDGHDRQALEQMIQNHQIKSVKLLGNQNNPYPFMKAADIFVSSAVFESYGLAIQEALVLGIPVVTTECPAIREVFDTRFGLIVDTDFDALYAAMEKMIRDPELRKGYQAEIKQNFKTEDLYEKRLQSICALWEE